MLPGQGLRMLSRWYQHGASLVAEHARVGPAWAVVVHPLVVSLEDRQRPIRGVGRPRAASRAVWVGSGTQGLRSQKVEVGVGRMPRWQPARSAFGVCDDYELGRRRQGLVASGQFEWSKAFGCSSGVDRFQARHVARPGVARGTVARPHHGLAVPQVERGCTSGAGEVGSPSVDGLGPAGRGGRRRNCPAARPLAAMARATRLRTGSL